jgi:hypothetical protein
LFAICANIRSVLNFGFTVAELGKYFGLRECLCGYNKFGRVSSFCLETFSQTAIK